MENVIIMDHPLIQHKISRLRDKTTGTNEFRTLVSEIAMLMGFEALRDLPTELVEIETPIETTKQPMIAGKKMAIVPILRAGLGMVDGVLNLVPSAKIDISVCIVTRRLMSHMSITASCRNRSTREPLVVVQA